MVETIRKSCISNGRSYSFNYIPPLTFLGSIRVKLVYHIALISFEHWMYDASLSAIQTKFDRFQIWRTCTMCVIMVVTINICLDKS